MVPWPTAPSWYGAYGWNSDDLPGLEYAEQQIWGIDGPEREPEPDFGLADEEPAPPPDTGVPVTRDGELGLPEEEPTRHEEPTSAWESDEEAAFEDERDAFVPPPADEPSGFEELDEPAPGGLVDEPEDDRSEELFPEPSAPPDLRDEEDTLDGARPPQPESTLEWDPFDDDGRR